MIVLEGEQDEAGEEGRRRIRPGHVLAHQPFDAHCNYIGARGVEILSLPWPESMDLPPMGHLGDVDVIVRLAERDARAASEAVAHTLVPEVDQFRDWPDLLADHLRGPGGLLRDWADRIGLTPETLSRGFRKLYGVSPARYRVEFRARKALGQIIGTTSTLAEIAVTCGFADQPHMCRAVRKVTGAPPSVWRMSQSNSFKTVSANSP